MKLEIKLGAVFEDPGPEAIAAALHQWDSTNAVPEAHEYELPQRAILSPEIDGWGDCYVQCVYSVKGGYILEYGGGNADYHIHCTREDLPIELIVNAFQAFAQGEVEARDDLEWERVDHPPMGTKSGCVGVVLLALATTAALCFSGRIAGVATGAL